jgi:hypothetical protein
MISLVIVPDRLLLLPTRSLFTEAFGQRNLAGEWHGALVHVWTAPRVQEEK